MADLSKQIRDADESLWRKIKKLLGVSTRTDAVGLVARDAKAASAVGNLLAAGAADSPDAPSSLLTSKPESLVAF